MSKGGKIVLAVLALGVIAFGVLLYLSHHNRNGDVGLPSPEEAPGLIKSLNKRLVTGKPLRLAETRASCKRSSGYVVQPGGSCSVDIPAPGRRWRWLSKSPVREMILTLSGASSARIELTQSGSVPMRRTLTAGSAERLRVFDDPATLNIFCMGAVGSQPCILRPR